MLYYSKLLKIEIFVANWFFALYYLIAGHYPKWIVSAPTPINFVIYH